MQFTPLAAVRHRLVIGRPLPFDVHDSELHLLLARGHVIESREQLRELLDRGAVINLAQLVSPRERARHAPREALPRMWSEGLSRIDRVLAAGSPASFRSGIEEAGGAVMGLVERDPDLAIFQILTHDADADIAYGARRSLNTAITSWLVAHRLGWDSGSMERVFKVALTMNLSMLELQGELARQDHPPTAAQRADLITHPMRSVELLAAAGITDPDWLQAVARHHELEDGSGYPTGRSDVGEYASLVRRADEYTAKLSSRSRRVALAADVAGRQMFMRDPGHPMTAALVKEFGIYPPGCFVRLASGELGVVVQRGPTVTTPVVACLTGPHGTPTDSPRRIETTDAAHAVLCIVGESEAPARPSPDVLIALRR